MLKGYVMESVNTNENRGNNRRLMERRSYNRRVIKYAFGSEQWLKNIQLDYLLWPKTDRRQGERRLTCRRILERRIKFMPHRRKSFSSGRGRQSFNKHILTTEERRMLKDLNDH